MGLLSKAIRRSQPRNVAFSEDFWPSLIGLKSKAGQTVTVDKALQCMTVLACLRVICEDVAQVSRGVYQKREDGGADPRPEHPLSRVFTRRANQWQTPFEFLEMLVAHVALAGRFVGFKNVVRGELREIIPFEPGCVSINADPRSGALTYKVTKTSGEQRDYPAEAIWHVKGLSYNGWDGLEILKLAREAIGLSIAAEEAHALLHANSGQTSGLYSIEGKLDDPQYKQLRDWIDVSTTGINKFKPFVLDRGAKFISTSMTGVDAEHVKTREHQVAEVCRAFRVMPIMIGFSDKTATYASSEQMFDAHVKYTLGGWFRRIEESIDAHLLSDAEWLQGIYFKFRPVSLLRGISKDRGEFYYKLWQMGALNANQIRAFEEWNPYEGGDVYRVPVNTASTDAGDGTNDEPPEPGQTKPEPGARRRAPHNKGRVLSAANEQLIREADDRLNQVLDQLDASPETEET